MVVSSKTDLRFPESGQQGHGARIIQTTLGTYGHLYPNTNLEVAKKLTGILQVQSATESIANYTSNQHTAIYHRAVEEK